MNAVAALARSEIVALEPYAHAAWLPTHTRLHANEAPWRPSGDDTRAGLNRYPEPQPRALLERLGQLYGVSVERVLATRGADEAIDVLCRVFLCAGADSILQCAPTFGMYEVAARIQGAGVVEASLEPRTGLEHRSRAVAGGLAARYQTRVSVFAQQSHRQRSRNRGARADLHGA